jgi:hypothetical protein
MKKLALAVAIVSLGAVAVIATAIAKNSHGDGSRSFSARLTGYEEIIPASATAGEGGAVSTVGEGRFRARVRQDPLRIEYTLEYEDLEGATTSAAHIHFGQRSTIGNVVAFLCGGGGKPACDPDTDTITGTIVAADVTGLAAVQGIAAGELPELIRAMRNGAAYVNVHTNTWPSGEIRGQVNGGDGHFKVIVIGGKGKGRDDD